MTCPPVDTVGTADAYTSFPFSINAASSNISHVTPPTPREASGPDERATTRQPFLRTSSFVLQILKSCFFVGGFEGSPVNSTNSSPHIQAGNWNKNSRIFVTICCARSIVLPITSTVCGDVGSARANSQAMKAPHVVVIPACLGLVVTTLFAFPRVWHKSFCLGNKSNCTSFLWVASYVLR